MSLPELAFRSSFVKRLVASGLAILLITLALREIAPGVPSAPDFAPGMSSSEVNIEIIPGETGMEIAKKLQEAGVVKSTEAYFRVAVGDKRSSTVAPGVHRIQRSIPAKEALTQLLDSNRIVDLVKVRDGAWWSEIRAEMIGAGFTAADLDRAFAKLKPPKGFQLKNLEGFLYPAFYSFPKEKNSEIALASMINRFTFSTKDVKWDSRPGFSASEILTIASLIESEGTPDVHRKVAQVIYNRLEKRMPLQFDSTVHYILKRRGEIFVSISDTKVRNRYNTFLNPGLPPGPIGSPTRASIDAALDPEPGDWLYFVTVEPSRTEFTSSYDEFLRLKSEYKKNLKAGKFK